MDDTLIKHQSRISMPLVGRSREVAELGALLQRSEVRLVTLTGPGGIGKSRLALEVSRAVAAHFEHGVTFVNLAPLTDPALVGSALAKALGLQQGAGALQERLVDFLKDRALLLVLDSFEVVAAGAPLLETLLTAAPKLKVLATSRSLLGLSLEREFRVEPLQLPEATSPLPELAASASVRLLVEGAQRLSPSFRLDEHNAAAVAGICARLDGLPLALELAASRLVTLGAEELLARLEKSALPMLFAAGPGTSERQRTLRQSFAWSTRLLTTGQQQTFAALSVFRGSFTLAAVSHVCGGDGPADLSALEHHHLVRVDGERFELLQTVRDFAAEQLEEAGRKDATADRHAEYFGALAREVGARVEQAATAVDLDLLELELDNLRASLEWLLRQGKALRGLDLAVSLGRFFDLRCFWLEGRRWLTAFVAAAGQSVLSSRALNQAGVIAFRQGDFPEALALHQRSLGQCTALHDRPGALDALDRLQWVAMYQGRTDDGAALARQGFALAEALGEPRRLARAMGQQAWVAFEQGQRAEAEEGYQRAVAMLELLPDRADLAYMLNALGEVQRGRGHFAEARESYQRCLRLAREVGSKRQMSPCLYNLAMVARSVGDRDTAVRYLLESVKLTQEIGNLQNLPLDLLSLAHLAALKGRARPAARVMGAGEALMKSLGVKVVFADKEDYLAAIGLLRAHLGPAEFEKLKAEGSVLSADAAIRLGVEALG